MPRDSRKYSRVPAKPTAATISCSPSRVRKYRSATSTPNIASRPTALALVMTSTWRMVEPVTKTGVVMDDARG
jgi:hypothetical protein